MLIAINVYIYIERERDTYIYIYINIHTIYTLHIYIYIYIYRPDAGVEGDVLQEARVPEAQQDLRRRVVASIEKIHMYY